jgi:hypothetical protein
MLDISAIPFLPHQAPSTWTTVEKDLDLVGINTIPELAAAAATIQIECSSWEPVREKQASPQQAQLYAWQQRYWPSGYYGRGFLQHTWRHNYDMLEKALQLPLLTQPDLLLTVPVASKAFAWFFKNCGAAQHARKQDWKNVRRFINGPACLHLQEFVKLVGLLLDANKGLKC